MHSTQFLVTIRSGPDGTRLVARTPKGQLVLSARLLAEPRHPRALPLLLKGLALWQGATVRAVLAVDGAPTRFDITRWHAPALVELELAPDRRAVDEDPRQLRLVFGAR